MAKATGLYEEIYELVRLIPPGKVANYGQIAEMHGGCGARQVGYALNHLRSEPHTAPVPWQRVVNARGEISLHGGGEGSFIQRELLEAEGVEFDAFGRIDLARFRWEPDVRLSAE
jgi:methylated-DNA-protein-cysteine methyltransferase-like protein